MTFYGMTFKESKHSNGLVFKTQANSLIEAKEYFVKLNQIPKKEFNKIFMVTKLNKKNKK